MGETGEIVSGIDMQGLRHEYGYLSEGRKLVYGLHYFQRNKMKSSQGIFNKGDWEYIAPDEKFDPSHFKSGQQGKWNSFDQSTLLSNVNQLRALGMGEGTGTRTAKSMGTGGTKYVGKVGAFVLARWAVGKGAAAGEIAEKTAKTAQKTGAVAARTSTLRHSAARATKIAEYTAKSTKAAKASAEATSTVTRMSILKG